MTLVNGYPAFKYHTDKKLILRDFTCSVALAMCTEAVEWEGAVATAATRGSPKPFWVCCHPEHGRQCYRRHLTAGAKP